MDREVREPLDLTELERVLGRHGAVLWPIGMGKSFHGVYDLAEDRVRVFRPGVDRLQDADEIISGLGNPVCASASVRVRAGAPRHRPGALPPQVLARRIPGGAANARILRLRDQQLRCAEVLDALVDIAPPPQPDRPARPGAARW
jgi:peptide chain release factor 3